MKTFIALLFTLVSTIAVAEGQGLYVIENSQMIDVKTFLESSNAQHDTLFCYKGDSNATMLQIQWLAKENENFYCDGCGGGYAFREVTLIRGFATYDLVISIESEVVPGDFRSVLIKPCR